jgi:hypothetical protein
VKTINQSRFERDFHYSMDELLSRPENQELVATLTRAQDQRAGGIQEHAQAFSGAVE